MIFFADESLGRQIIVRLRQDGHAVLDVTEMDPGISDDMVLSMANESKTIGPRREPCAFCAFFLYFFLTCSVALISPLLIKACKS